MSELLTPERLWDLPRVGAPMPLPGGAACIVPVTTHDGPRGAGITRLWQVALDGAPPRALTAAGASSAEPAVRPDGGAVAFVRAPGEGAGATHGGAGQLYVLPLDGGEPTRHTDLALGVAAPRWLPDGRIAFLAPVFADAPTPAATAERVAARADDPLDVHVTDDRVYRYWDRWLTDGRVHHLFVLDPSTGEIVDLTPSSRRWMALMETGEVFDLAPDGREAAFHACRTEPPFARLLWGVYTVPIPPPGAPVAAAPRLVSSDELDGGSARRPVYSPDGRHLLYGLQREHDFYADPVRLTALDRASGAHVVLTDGWDRSAADWTFDPADPRTLWLTTEDEGRTALCALDLAAALAEPAAHPPRVVARDGTLGAPRLAGGRAFVQHARLDAPPEAAVVDPGASTPRRITRFAEEALAGVTMGAVEDITFAGADDAPVQMFLVHPPGADAGAVAPLVHLIHGGPHGAFGDGWHWRWCAQTFAAAGHRVALVNFHGSTGWGDAFTRSILGRWGDQPARDVVAATDLLVARGLAEEGRMAIAGGSYGGYLVSWLAATTADRFACAVNHAGVCDFQTQFASDVTQGRRRSMGGELWSDVDGLDRWNPLRHAAGFRTPMLVLHGMRDYRVPHAQGLQIHNVYQARGLTSRLVVYPGENHWILGRANSLHWYGEVLGWLGRWLGAAPAEDGGAPS